MSHFSPTFGGRLRSSHATNGSVKESNGWSQHTNGEDVPSKAHGHKSAKPTSQSGDVQALLQILGIAQQHAQGSPVKGEYDQLIKLALRMLQEERSEIPLTIANGNGLLPKQPSAQDTTSQDALLVTPLGGLIINSSDEPVAVVDANTSLPTASSVSDKVHPQQAIAAAALLSVDSTAPKFKPQAQVWQDVIDAGRNGGSLDIDGDELSHPALLAIGDSGALVRVPLTTAVDASSAHVALNKTAHAALFQPRQTFQSLAVLTPTAPTTAEIPTVLLKANLAGNEATTVPAGFVLVGDIKVLGGKIDAELYKFQGSAGDEQAALAVISQSPVPMDDLLPSPGFSFGSIMLQHPSISAYKKSPPSGKDIGLWVDAGIAFVGPFADAGAMLHDTLATTTPSLDVSAHIGGYQAISDAFKAPNEVLFTGALTGLDAHIGKFLELKSVNVNLHGVRGLGRGYVWLAFLSGDALITVPGSIAPLTATYSLTKAQSTYTIELKLTNPEWSDAMGVPGFHLNNATFKATFTSGTKDAPFSFDIDASFALGATVVKITGQYSNDGWNFHATVGDFTLAQVEAAFAKLFKADLSPTTHDVVFTGLSLDINSKDKTLDFKGGVRVDSYTSASATLNLGPTGVHVIGDVANAKFDLVTLTKAHLELVLTKAGLVNPDPKTPGTAAAFTISGEVVINSAVTLDAEVSFAKSGSSFVWVVYAKATTNFFLSKFANVPKELDIELESVVAMASNTDDGSLFPVKAFDYAVKKGFRLSAKIDCPATLAKALHSNPLALTLELDLSSAAKEVDFLFAADQSLSLKPGMVAPSIKAGITLTANPQIFVEGDMSVQLSGNPGPLDFALRLQVGATEAQASASLTTDWVNPFHVGPKVRVLAPVTLGVIIDYAAVTYPSGLSFEGGIQLGETKLIAAFEVGENPEDGVLLVHAENLNLRDIVSFASLVIEHDLPLPPPEILDFKDLYLGVSSGGTIGSVFYPPGVTFNADVVIFGKEAKINCAVDKSLPGFKIQAEIDAFTLGPVTVSGNKAKNPSFDLEFGTKLQQLSIDGKIALFDSDVAANIDVVMVPPSVTFDAELKFSDLLTFKIDAHAAGEIKSIKDVVKADFSIYALLEQKLLDQMVAWSNTYIATAKKATDEGLESAKGELAKAQAAYNDALSAAQRKLDAAQVAWEKKEADVTAAANAAKKALQDQEAAKRADVDKAQKAFNAKIQQLTDELQQTKNDAAAKVQAAQDKLNSATKDADDAINSAKAKLTDAQNDLTRRFGNADQALKDAQAKVNSAQSFVDSCQKDVNDCENQIAHGNFIEKAKALAKIGGYEAALRAAQLGLFAANGVLTAATAVVNGPGYQAAKAAITLAQGSLDAANKTADASLAAAKGSLSAAQAAAKASVSAAQLALDAAKTGSQELHVFDAAKAALDAFLKTEQAGLDAAAKLITDLATCVEKVAFDAANAGLAVAKSATKEISAAQDILSAVEKAADEFAAFGQWLVNHAGNIFNLKKVEISGSLNDAANKKPFMAHVVGKFADADVDVQVQFTPGQAEDFVKGLVMKWVDEAKADLKKFIH